MRGNIGHYFRNFLWLTTIIVSRVKIFGFWFQDWSVNMYWFWMWIFPSTCISITETINFDLTLNPKDHFEPNVEFIISMSLILKIVIVKKISYPSINHKCTMVITDNVSCKLKPNLVSLFNLITFSSCFIYILLHVLKKVSHDDSSMSVRFTIGIDKLSKYLYNINVSFIEILLFCFVIRYM